MATGHLKPRENKDGSKSYQVVIELEKDPITGKRERRYKTVKGTKKQAQAMLCKMLADYNSGNIVNSSAMKLGSWMDQWLRTYNPNIEATTRDSYEEKIRIYIKPMLGSIPLNILNANTIQSFINDMIQRGLSPKTIRNTYNILNPALNKAVDLDMLPHSPCKGVVLPKLKKPRVDVYDKEESKQVLEVAKGTDIYLLVLLGLTVGMRRGEIAALQWSNIDFKKQTIKVCENRVHASKSVIQKAPKSAAGNRIITVGNDVIAELQKAKNEYDDRAKEAWFHKLDYVVCKEDGTPYHPDSLTQKWERFTARHNLRHIKLHGMRHTNATTMIAAGVSPKVVQQRLGHADVSVTLNTYTHVLPSMDQEAADKIDDILFA